MSVRHQRRTQVYGRAQQPRERFLLFHRVGELVGGVNSRAGAGVEERWRQLPLFPLLLALSLLGAASRPSAARGVWVVLNDCKQGVHLLVGHGVFHDRRLLVLPGPGSVNRLVTHLSLVARTHRSKILSLFADLAQCLRRWEPCTCGLLLRETSYTTTTRSSERWEAAFCAMWLCVHPHTLSGS